MKFDQFELADKDYPFAKVHFAAEAVGFVHGEQWDYERAMFDYKIVNQGDIYYLRLPVYAMKGDIPKDSTVVQLMTPLLGKHYYPHGVEYVDETFPKAVVDQCTRKLEQLKAKLEAL